MYFIHCAAINSPTFALHGKHGKFMHTRRDESSTIVFSSSFCFYVLNIESTNPPASTILCRRYYHHRRRRRRRHWIFRCRCWRDAIILFAFTAISHVWRLQPIRRRSSIKIYGYIFLYVLLVLFGAYIHFVCCISSFRPNIRHCIVYT